VINHLRDCEQQYLVARPTNKRVTLHTDPVASSHRSSSSITLIIAASAAP